MAKKMISSKSMKKYAVGGGTPSRNTPPSAKPEMVNPAFVGPKKPTMKKGGSTSFAKLAPPYDKATYADKIAGAKMKKGGSIKKKK